MKRMGYDDQMRGIQTNDQIRVHPGEVGRDNQMRDHKTIDKVHVLPGDG